jgi:hypothetical protein
MESLDFKMQHESTGVLQNELKSWSQPHILTSFKK